MTLAGRPGPVPEPLSLFLTTFTAAAGKAATREGSKLLRELVGLQEEQIALLRSLDVKVDALQAGPLRTGMRQLRDALSAARDERDRDRLLKEARASFTAALAQDLDHVRRSLAALHLATIWLALGSEEDVRDRLAECHQEALVAIAETDPPTSGLWDRVVRKTGLRRRDAVLWARFRLPKLFDYANAVAQARRAWGASPETAPVFTPELRLPPSSLLRFSPRFSSRPSALDAGVVPEELSTRAVSDDVLFTLQMDVRGYLSPFTPEFFASLSRLSRYRSRQARRGSD